jgi:hypothetical protein
VECSQLDGVPLEDTLGSVICLAPHISISHGELVERFPTAISRWVNGIRLVEWAWLLPAFHIDATKSKSNLLAKVWRSVVSGSVCGIRFGNDGRNALVQSVGAVVLPSMKQGCHYCCLLFAQDGVVSAYCTCKGGNSTRFNLGANQSEENVA